MRIQTSEVLPESPKSASLSLNFSVTSIYTQPIRSYLKQTNFNLLSKQCNLHLKLLHSVGGLCLLCKQPISNYALSFNCYQPLFNFLLILSKRPLDSYVNKSTPLYLKYALDMTISVCLVNIERYSEKILYLYFRYKIN